MGSQTGGKDTILQVEDTPISRPTVEIKIKTLDFQTYTLRVDKCVPVPTLKEQIASVTGILSERQRLICRGRVLKDDQLLSAYHVEDGHTLHLVVREPAIPPSESANDHAGANEHADTQGATGAGGPRVVVGSFNISSEQGQGGFPDLGRILSAVIGSLGVSLNRNTNTSDNTPEPSTFVVHSTNGSGSFTESIRMQPVNVAIGGQPNPTTYTFQAPPANTPAEYLQPPVIPDSLTTLSQYLNQVTVEFALANGGEQNSPVDDVSDTPEVARVSLRRGLPTPENLAEVLESTRQLLINQTAESLARLATQLQNQASETDSSARVSIQSNAMRSGILLRNLGALLLELGRTTMLLRMGETPADAVVNAGSAVFVNESGPNPIMVQPFPTGSMNLGSGFGPGFGTFMPRNVDIRIRTGATNQGGQSGTQLSSEPVSQATTGTPTTASNRQAEVHIRPIRAMFGAAPARQSQSSDSAQRSDSMFVPVVARVQQTSANSNETGAAVDRQAQPVGGQSASAAEYIEELNSSLDEYLRNMFNIVDEQPHPHTASTNDQHLTATGISANAPQTTATSTATATSDDGVFLSNILQQIMPFISQNVSSGSGGPSSVGDGSGQGNAVHESSNARSSSRRETDRPPSPDSKRQRKEQ